ncbi:MAG TPA: tetratricopeptide repeat protein [Candidatus Paceibacterota bacterium]|nr:tetratricopeptide repeat protein [Candidatus Paceibacterota bacterium]
MSAKPWLCLALAAAIVAVYWPVSRHAFINYDDLSYVTENQHVSKGLSWAGVNWAFGRLHGERTYWHPLTWISHMVDCQVFGLKPAGHHLMNVLFHLLNTTLLFLVFLRMTGAFWRCAVLAGLFALHPLQVDTVAWVAERKNLLATLFGLLAIWAYAAYVTRSRNQGQKSPPNPKSDARNSEFKAQGLRFSPGPSTSYLPFSILYLLSLCLFALSLMSKPMLVALPFALLLLDYWPLNRRGFPNFQHAQVPLPRAPIRRLVLEKLPFLLLAAASCVITVQAHRGLGMLDPGSGPSLGFRLENALVSYARYLGNALWPAKLAVFYPFPAAWPLWTVAASGLLLLALTALVVRTARSRPYLFVGWFWFTGLLVPTIGLIQAGAQALADRFAYLPLVGLFLGLVWTAAEWSRRGPRPARMLAFGAVILLLLSAGLSRRQLAHWQNTETLFRHALAVTKDNFLAHGKLGEELAASGRLSEAEAQFAEAVKINPGYLPVLNSLASRLSTNTTSEASLRLYQQAVRSRPQDATAHYNLAVALTDQQRVTEAMAEYSEALRLDPNLAPAHNNLSSLFLAQGNPAAALPHALAALRLKPDFPQAHFNAGNALFLQEKFADAASHYATAAKLDPGNLDARLNLAKALVSQNKLQEAESQLKEVARLQPANAEPHQLLAAIYSASNRAGEAVNEYTAALDLDPDWADGLNHLAWIRATHANSALRDAAQAVELATRACNLTGSTNATYVATLAAAYAEAGMFTEAVSYQQLACDLAAAYHLTGQPPFAPYRLELYRSQQPFRDLSETRVR